MAVGDTMQGEIVRIPVDNDTQKRRGFCFIRGDDGADYFLHATGLHRTAGLFVNLNEGDRMEFVVTDGDKGLRATEARRL